MDIGYSLRALVNMPLIERDVRTGAETETSETILTRLSTALAHQNI